MKLKFLKTLWLWTWLGLDAPSIALVWALYFAKTQNVQIPLVHSFCLFGAVWGVYIADRLLDSKKIKRHPSSRHHFYQKYFKSMKILFFVVLTFTLLSLTAVSPSLLLWGTPIAICMVLYGWVAHRSGPQHLLHSSKELLVPPIFVLGISLNTLEQQFTLNLQWWGICLTFLVFINLMSISSWDLSFDKENNTASFAQAAPKVRPHFLTILTTILYLGFFGYTGGSFPTAPYWISLFSLLLLQTISKFLSEDTKRFAIDFVLLSPLLYLL